MILQAACTIYPMYYGWGCNMFFFVATLWVSGTVYPKKYAHGFCFAVLCCGYTLTDFPISIRLTSLALWQSNNCPSASKATLMNMDKYFMWIHYERLHNHNKAKHNKTVCIFLGIYCMCSVCPYSSGLSHWHFSKNVCIRASEVTLKDMGEINHYPNTTKQYKVYIILRMSLQLHHKKASEITNNLNVSLTANWNWQR